MNYRKILELATVAEASALAADSFKKRKTFKPIKSGTKIIVGSALIKAQADLI